jgi:L-iditol 2-dehydrogenase
MMKAAIYYGPGDIQIQEIEKPDPGVNGMIIKVAACGICPLLDVPRYKRKLYDHASGIAFGHECSGEVVGIGPKVKVVKLGDRVHGMSYRPCHRCEACQSGNYGRCLNFTEGIAGTWINGGFAEYLLFPFVANENIIILPDNMSYRDAALIEPVTVAVGLAGKAKEGDVAVVLGQEFMGLATVTQLKARGVAKVIVGDLSCKRLDKSREAGADIVVNELESNIITIVMKETSGKGADVVIETAGRPATFLQSIDLIKEHGSIWLGSFYDGPFLFDPSLVRPDMPHSNLTQKHGISIHCPWLTFDDRTTRRVQAMELVRSGKITAQKFVSHYYPLEKIKEAFETASNPLESIKVIIEP